MLHRVSCLVVGVLVVACSGSTSGGGGPLDGGGGSSNGGSGGASNGGSGGTSTGGSGAGTGNCQTACNNIASANCPNASDVPTCIAECEADLGGGSCAAEVNALVGCVSAATFTCGTNGTVDIAKACGSAAQAHAVCSACIPNATDDACDTCSRASCCSQRTALYGDPNLFAMSDCLQACTDSACSQACQEQFPSTFQAALTLSQCESDSCPVCGP